MQMQEREPFELEVVSVRLVKDTPLFSDHKITAPQDAVEAVGAVNQTIAEPRELFKASILSNAAQMLMVHNHPSGELKPSKEDVMITDRMLKLTELMGIKLADHVIVGGDNSQYFSFREKKLLHYPRIYLSTDCNALEFGKTAMVAEKGRAR